MTPQHVHFLGLLLFCASAWVSAKVIGPGLMTAARILFPRKRRTHPITVRTEKRA